MATVSIAYTVPIQVWVDVEAGIVRRAVVVDEEIKQDPAGYFEVLEGGAADDLKDRAYAAADEAMWPSWEHGF